MLLKIEKWFDALSRMIGYVCAFLMIVMMLNIFYDVCMRYAFKSGSIALQELEWHLFSVIFLLGMSYALMEDSHVRVDVLYAKWSERRQAAVNIIGAVLFITPIALLVMFSSLGFVSEAYVSHEVSSAPGGLTQRWILKAFIPFSFAVLLLMEIGFIVKNIAVYKGLRHANAQPKETL
ncbi:TRAP transporter small permease subunit [Sulfurospirillum sp. hDNRA2]|uniref:TRAP transporter small permease subunit n=1 Tax=Sulfurospirillum TaxID=57665 RepID=UPI0020B80E00|nr:TRAP transporter small permease subunit [Sulfurospirillum sp. DNRA8]MCP3651872.1 TRAP transporter small permease subunit [Sulfurospirillum sp. DNRA8]MCR1810719.1 TRAP transporter small permease subunit [Sulfurospirillum sp. DNRA8]